MRFSIARIAWIASLEVHRMFKEPLTRILFYAAGAFFSFLGQIVLQLPEVPLVNELTVVVLDEVEFDSDEPSRYQ